MREDILAKYPKYLPLGSVVMLHENNKKLMIVGYLHTDLEKEVYDYLGCYYPEGVNDNDYILFNHEEIERILAIGLKLAEWQNFSNILLKA